MIKPTPGPWRVIGKQGYAVWCGNEIITSAMSGHTISPSTAHANARLIAAAPDLLEALRLAADIIGHPEDAGSMVIAAAITKATGA